MKNVTIEMVREMMETKNRKGLQAIAKPLEIDARQATVKMGEAIIAFMEQLGAVEQQPIDETEAKRLADIDEIFGVEESVNIMDYAEEFVDESTTTEEEVTMTKGITMQELLNAHNGAIEEEYVVELTQAEILAICEVDADKFSILGQLQERLIYQMKFAKQDEESQQRYEEAVVSASEASASSVVVEEVSTPPVVEQAASEASSPQDTRWFEFVKADNCIVEFKQKGKRVIIGWSKKDFKSYIAVEGKEPRLYSPMSAIKDMSKFTNEMHGDVARIVHALARIKTKPGIIRGMEEYARRNVNETRKENLQTVKPNRTRNTSVVDPQWLSDYQARMGDAYDARNVRRDYEAYLSAATYIQEAERAGL